MSGTLPANQLWTELNDQQAQSVSGGNFGQDTQGFFDELRATDPSTFPPNRANIEVAFGGNAKNFGQVQSAEARIK